MSECMMRISGSSVELELKVQGIEESVRCDE